MPLPYDSPATGDPTARKGQARAQGEAASAIARILKNLGIEQAKDVKGLAYGLTVDPMNQMGRAMKERKLIVEPTPEEADRAKRGLALLLGGAAGGVAGAASKALAPGRPMLRAMLAGGTAGGTDSAIRTGGDPAATAGGAALGAGAGRIFGKMAETPGTLATKNPFESVERSLRGLGPEGERIADLIKTSNRNANVDAGTAVHALTEAGLDKLGAYDDAMVGLALRGRVDPKELSPAAKTVFDVAHSLRTGFATKAAGQNLQILTHKGEKVPFKARENYYPQGTPQISDLEKGPVREDAIANAVAMGHYPDEAAATKALDSWLEFAKGGGQRGGDAYVELLAKRMNTTPDRARGMLLRQVDRAKSERYGNLERAREFDFEFYDPSPKRNLGRWGENSARRLAEVEHLGQDLENLGGPLGAMQGNDRQLAEYLAKAGVAMRQGGDPRTAGVLGMGRQIATTKLSPTSSIKNLGQSLNTLLTTDIGSTAGGIKDAFTKAGRDFAEEAGATTEGALRHSQHMVGAESNFLRRYLNAIGFTGAEKFNRTVASNAGRRYAEKMARKAAAGDEFAMRELSKLGLDPEAMGRYSQLHPRESKLAGQAVTDRSQFNASGLDLPPTVRDNPIMWSAAQYKTYPYQQTNLLRSEIIDRLGSSAPGDKRRAARNIAMLLGVGQVAGEGINNAVATVKEGGKMVGETAMGNAPQGGDVLKRLMAAGLGRTRKEAPWSGERFMANQLAPGGIGILSDMAGNLEYNPAEYAAGPAMGTAFNLAGRAARAVSRDKEPSNADLRYLYRQVPTVGGLTVDAVLPKEESRKNKPKNPRKRKENSQ